jgi:hypothetical protein
MFVRKKVVDDHIYLQIVEGRREGGRVRQRVIASLGRLDQLREDGDLDALVASAARFSEHLAVLGDHKAGLLEPLRTQSIGPALVFGRLWQECGVADTLHGLLRHRAFGFDAERAVFLCVLQRLLCPGSDRASVPWRRDTRAPGTEGLELHHLYRAMAWLGEQLPEDQQRGRTPFAARCTKDLVEERLFEKRRDLFSELVLVFFDTTSIYFEGRGGESVGQRGKSKDHRPDLVQIVVGLVIDNAGRPLCCELWPGNTTDVKTLIPVVERLRTRFRVGRICIVADRGMISHATIEALEGMQLEYILGARMRSQKEVSAQVVARAGRYQEVVPPRDKAKDPSPLKVKEVWVDKRRYVVCFNEEQARKDAADRAAIVASLREKLRQGDKSLVGNKGYRKYLRTPRAHLELDEQKVKREARYDGKWVLRTNIDAPKDVVALTYKELWMVESMFRSAKSLLETRPVYHKRDETIRGHVFVSFLALVIMRELQERLRARGCQQAEWADVLRDLQGLIENEVKTADGKGFIIRSEVKGWCGKAFQAAGVAVPPTVRALALAAGS